MKKIRNIIVLLLCVTAGLLSTENDRASRISCEEIRASLSIDRTQSDQWQCERICNSDLNLTGTSGHTLSVQLPAFVRPGAERAADCAAASCTARLAQRLRRSDMNCLCLSGTRAADYYVYRLCRLII